MARTSVKRCSPECIFYKRIWKPFQSSECMRINDGYYHRPKNYLQYCRFFEQRERIDRKMFKIRSKGEITNKYIQLLKKENKTEIDYAKIELLEWILKVEENLKNDK